MINSVSKNGIMFIARREGLVLTAYPDGDHMSIGFGHNNPKLSPGDTITAKRAFELLSEDIQKREPMVNKYLKVPVTQGQFDALFSLYYQGGTDGLEAVASYINKNDLQGAAKEFLMWDTNAKGKRIPGLLKRRGLEVAIFLAEEYGSVNPIPYWPGDPHKTKMQQYTLSEGDLP